MSRERILVIGNPGSGKTTSWLSIAKHCPNATFHVIDPDDGVDRLRESEFPGLKNINYYLTPFWYQKLVQVGPQSFVSGVIEALADIKTKLKPEDWIVVEHLGLIWDSVQIGYIDSVFSSGIDEYFLSHKKLIESKRGLGDSAKMENPLDGWKDWGIINKMHDAGFLIPICYQLPVNVFMTSTFSMQTPMLATKESSDLQNVYVGTKVRVDGNKKIPFKVQTMLLLGGNPQTGFTLDTFQKDRGRNWVKNVKLIDFYLQYMVAVAKWKI